jgi:Zn finger protein HypA/HybF involved in hydrogenase expression
VKLTITMLECRECMQYVQPIYEEEDKVWICPKCGHLLATVRKNYKGEI